jgi:hypothetical protein
VTRFIAGAIIVAALIGALVIADWLVRLIVRVLP